MNSLLFPLSCASSQAKLHLGGLYSAPSEQRQRKMLMLEAGLLQSLKTMIQEHGDQCSHVGDLQSVRLGPGEAA